MRHTPGPWDVVQYQAAPDWYVVGNLEGKMAYVSTEADARLIAAAPELLRVLVSLLEHGNSAPGPLWGEASAAIAKATGEPS